MDCDLDCERGRLMEYERSNTECRRLIADVLPWVPKPLQFMIWEYGWEPFVFIHKIPLDELPRKYWSMIYAPLPEEQQGTLEPEVLRLNQRWPQFIVSDDGMEVVHDENKDHWPSRPYRFRAWCPSLYRSLVVDEIDFVNETVTVSSGDQFALRDVYLCPASGIYAQASASSERREICHGDVISNLVHVASANDLHVVIWWKGWWYAAHLSGTYRGPECDFVELPAFEHCVFVRAVFEDSNCPFSWDRVWITGHSALCKIEFENTEVFPTRIDLRHKQVEIKTADITLLSYENNPKVMLRLWTGFAHADGTKIYEGDEEYLCYTRTFWSSEVKFIGGYAFPQVGPQMKPAYRYYGKSWLVKDPPKELAPN